MHHLPKLAFLSCLGEVGRYDPSLFENAPGQDDETYWFELMLRDAGLDRKVRYTGYHVCRGVPFPGDDEFDALVIGGSFHSVHDDRPFQKAVLALLDRLWKNEKPTPVFGICGGHQLMCTYFGTTVTRVDAGAQGATQSIELTDSGRDHWLFDGQPGVPDYHFGNEEHAAVPPTIASVLATHPAIPVAALDYGHGWVSTQFHPEADHAIMAGSWRDSRPEFMDRYRPTPHAPRLFENFLVRNGVVPA